MICSMKAARTVYYNVSQRISSFFIPTKCPQLELAGFPGACYSSIQATVGPSLSDCLWLAVPKSKITRSKKRMKTTNQKRIKLKDHIIVDKRTGELTLRHKMPFNWKDYLPETS
mmetsp:Transcript_30251/g.29151  ORF Transcript_30251/g.29151 Transcript_30251/m.29151 type:complete len:114 (-) Transcript_30251:242-583(-)